MENQSLKIIQINNTARIRICKDILFLYMPQTEDEKDLLDEAIEVLTEMEIDD